MEKQWFGREAGGLCQHYGDDGGVSAVDCYPFISQGYRSNHGSSRDTPVNGG